MGRAWGCRERFLGEVRVESVGTTWGEGEGRQDDREDPVFCSEDIRTCLDGHKAACGCE